MKVALLDYGVGNVASVRRALERQGAEVLFTSDPELVAGASRVVLPGVGAFAPARERLRESGLDGALRVALGSGARLLGLCLGFQLLFAESTEFGVTEGLGLLPGRVAAFDAGLRVPHIGWNSLEPVPGSRMLAGLPDGCFVYFVHSFRAEGVDAGSVAAWCDYGGRFPAAVEKGGIWGCQFHPEKSSEVGRVILRNFLAGETEAA